MSNAIEKFEAPTPTLTPASETVAIVQMIERAAANPAVDVEKFARLLEMRERVEAQFARKAFAAAVASAKSKIGPIFKDKGVDFTTSKGRTNYKFEGFDTVARAVDPVLSELGLFYRFRAEQGGGKLRMTCVLSHKDGHEEETTLEGSEDHSGNKNSLQAVGSAATYLQRYTLKCALGLSTSLDDDAQSVGRAPAIECGDKDDLIDEINDCGSVTMLKAWFSGKSGVINGLSNEDRDKVRAAYSARQKEVSANG